MEQEPELLKRQTSSFASAPQPLEKQSFYLMIKVSDALTISSYPIIGVVASQFIGCCFHDVGCGLGTGRPYPLFEKFQFRCHTLTDAFASYTEHLATL